MWRLVCGVLLGIVISGVPVYALRITKPPTITEWNTNTLSQLNDVLEEMWLITNGRYSLDITVSDPDGSLRGDKGDMILYDPGANEELCVNVDSSTGWDCSSLT